MLQEVDSFQLRERQPDQLFPRIFNAVRIQLQLQPAGNLVGCGVAVTIMPNQSGSVIKTMSLVSIDIVD